MGNCGEVEPALRATGMLVRQDKLLPSVVDIITEERLLQRKLPDQRRQ